MSVVLVTGGAGYIGSHAVLQLMQVGHSVVVIDNLSNANPQVFEVIRELNQGMGSLDFYEEDIRDRQALRRIFQRHAPDAVIHFAGLKAVGESVAQPLKYYENNVGGSIALFEVMAEQNVFRLVFSSSATVYGFPERMPIVETDPVNAAAVANPYARTKVMIEGILQDLHRADPRWSVMLLRYFNPVGAHPSGRLGEDPSGVPNNLMPLITQVAVGRRTELLVTGTDYPTPDGTGVRDYLHIMDLVEGHLAALNFTSGSGGVEAVNLGNGRGYSVLEMIKAFETANGVKIPYRLAERRPGDIAVSYADPSKANRLLGWKAKLDLEAMCADAWRWQKMNPSGYGEAEA